MEEPKSIDLVLLLLEQEGSEELGAALWAAFKEVEAFYNLDTRRANFRMHSLLGERGDHNRRRRMISDEGISLKSPTAGQLRNIKGRFSRTVDAQKVLSLVDELLVEQEADARVIVIDQELTPPRNWRYVIWSRRVISTVPTDPRFWGMKDPDRIAIIKHRVRTACLSNVGSLIGLGRCNNWSCFLYRKVDSTMRLDEMVKLGPEHRIAALEGRGFDILSTDPGAVQPIIVDPMPKRWFYER